MLNSRGVNDGAFNEGRITLKGRGVEFSNRYFFISTASIFFTHHASPHSLNVALKKFSVSVLR